jgi:hypothetical protein
MAYQIVCNGVVNLANNGTARCPSGWLIQQSTAPFDISQIDPSVATAMFGSGFVLFITPWATAWGFSQLLKLLR